MRGLSKMLPGIGTASPMQFGFGEYVGNIAHSNLMGFRTYPHGTAPGYLIKEFNISQVRLRGREG